MEIAAISVPFLQLGLSISSLFINVPITCRVYRQQGTEIYGSPRGFSDLTQCNFYQFLPPSFFSYINNGSFMLVWRGESQLSGEVVDLAATSLGG